MSYSYKFDDTPAGDARFSRPVYELVQSGLELLRERIAYWNDRTSALGAQRPYDQEVRDLDKMITWGRDRLATDAGEIWVNGIWVGSLRNLKAGLRILRETREEELGRLKHEGWPSAALESVREKVAEIDRLLGRNPHPEAEVLWEILSRPIGPVGVGNADEWDVFVSHATEDKDAFVRPLAEALRGRGLQVWFDEFTLRVGDSLRRSIDRGLARSRYGVVVISRSFLAKEWPQKELDGLVALEVEGRKVILPVWHEITPAEVCHASPLLADRFASSSAKGLESVVADLMTAMQP